jgi:coenzyme F420-0:L-glutamate ligase/coenzyme F420-1:gamma-L-glutamate ligase
MGERADKAAGSLSLLALEGIPEVLPGMALAPLIVAALKRHSHTPSDGDVLLVCQKVVSKSENRFVDLASVQVSGRAHELAALCGKDPRLVEIVLRESTAVVRCAPRISST